MKIRHGEMRRVASRSVWAAIIALTSSCINMLILTISDGRERGWVCLGFCGTDVRILLFHHWPHVNLTSPPILDPRQRLRPLLDDPRPFAQTRNLHREKHQGRFQTYTTTQSPPPYDLPNVHHIQRPQSPAFSHPSRVPPPHVVQTSTDPRHAFYQLGHRTNRYHVIPTECSESESR